MFDEDAFAEDRELLILGNRPFISSTFAERARDQGFATATHSFEEFADESSQVGERYSWVVVDVCGDPTSALEHATAIAPEDAHLVLLITCEGSIGRKVLARLLSCRPAGVLGAGMAPGELVGMLDLIDQGHVIVHLDGSGETGQHLQTLLLRGAQTASVPMLDDDERQLLGMVAEGLSDDEIATNMFISEATVRRRISTLRKRTETSRRVELAAWAGAHGYYERSTDAATA